MSGAAKESATWKRLKGLKQQLLVEMLSYLEMEEAWSLAVDQECPKNTIEEAVKAVKAGRVGLALDCWNRLISEPRPPLLDSDLVEAALWVERVEDAVERVEDATQGLALGRLKAALAEPCDNCKTEGQRKVLDAHGFGDGCPECDGTRKPDGLVLDRELLESVVEECSLVVGRAAIAPSDTEEQAGDREEGGRVQELGAVIQKLMDLTPKESYSLTVEIGPGTSGTSVKLNVVMPDGLGGFGATACLGPEMQGTIQTPSELVERVLAQLEQSATSYRGKAEGFARIASTLRGSS